MLWAWLFCRLMFIIGFVLAEDSNLPRCRIYSSYFKVYLYGKYKLLGWSRSVGVWNEEIDYKYSTGNENQTFIPKVYFTDNDPSGVWFFEPVPGRPDTFYIRNNKYENEYLRGSDSFEEWIFKKRNRLIYTEKMSDRMDEWFMWTLKRAVGRSKDNVALHIFNVKLALPLYTREYYTGQGGGRKKSSPEMYATVSLWNDPRPYTEKFDWSLKCEANRLPEITD